MENEKKKALIIDNNLLQRKTIAGYLRSQFECSECRSIEQALTLTREHQFSIIIVEFEINPPSLGGEPVLTQLKAEQPGAKILATTRAPSESLVYAAMRQGIDAIVIKPINSRILCQKIEETMTLTQPVSFRTLEAQTTLNMKVEETGLYTIIHLFGKLVGRTLSSFKIRLDGLVRNGKKMFAVDLEKVTEIDQAAFRLLTKACDALRKSAGALCLFNVAHFLRTIMDNIQLVDAIPVYLDAADFRRDAARTPVNGMIYPRRQALIP